MWREIQKRAYQQIMSTRTRVCLFLLHFYDATRIVYECASGCRNVVSLIVFDRQHEIPSELQKRTLDLSSIKGGYSEDLTDGLYHRNFVPDLNGIVT